MNNRLFIGNLPFAATEDYLRQLFEESGHRVEELQIVKDRETGRSRGFAFATLAEGVDAGRVIAETNGQSFMGSRLTVRRAVPREAVRPVAFKRPGPGNR